MQLIFPRFTGSQLVNFARGLGDICDLKSVTIDDTTDGKAGFGQGQIETPTFTLEAHDGTTATLTPAQGPDLNPLLSSRFVLAELDRARKNKSDAAAAAPAVTLEARPFKFAEALRILDRIRNEVGGIKARFPAGFEPQNDATVYGEILFNDKTTINVSFSNSGPMTPELLMTIIEHAKAAQHIQGAPSGADIERAEAATHAQQESKG